jgi:glutaminase
MPNHFTNKFIYLGHFSATLQLWFGHCKIDVSFHMLASTMMQKANHGFHPNTEQKSLSFTIMDGKEKLKY